jgi:hypothetical protein
MGGHRPCARIAPVDLADEDAHRAANADGDAHRDTTAHRYPDGALCADTYADRIG